MPKQAAEGVLSNVRRPFPMPKQAAEGVWSSDSFAMAEA
jgi:hypothetical protein